MFSNLLDPDAVFFYFFIFLIVFFKNLFEEYIMGMLLAIRLHVI